jgi:hypothetical protein
MNRPLREKGLLRARLLLRSSVRSCNVGITANKRDITNLGLDAFICSDFDSVPGSSTFPPRDCAAVDAEWRARPTPDSAPW